MVAKRLGELVWVDVVTLWVNLRHSLARGKIPSARTSNSWLAWLW